MNLNQWNQKKLVPFVNESKETGLRSDEEPKEEEPKPMKNEIPTKIDKSKIKGMDYYLALEPI